LSRVVFPEPRKPERTVTGSLEERAILEETHRQYASNLQLGGPCSISRNALYQTQSNASRSGSGTANNAQQSSTAIKLGLPAFEKGIFAYRSMLL
jgi:hypothetical protein